ncbi:hypothetical protein TVAG_259270 [Trichomonas vaginalis G3]|uniref:Uncharacterized protein n=1 Tax=Trichomonas vaginalis (strain ATCC PRA-98 / G3) TaxID=412133 RepID=A2EBX8_TRIV3|nr:hypothetical protein TVAGG3_0652510 [Trichomonas vaginalis G3]EAY09846.1 hypothetical protein TVAG_259270 [Trichomonas vaginalis G3]KAI5505924.1 hypothetical protein TVAGG3_0652510 [Trichomonas vaginalis G3]|eukprot:XP_001322069.1 hypothetical protein [Trichomonas vaginalis G3]
MDVASNQIFVPLNPDEFEFSIGKSSKLPKTYKVFYFLEKNKLQIANPTSEKKKLAYNIHNINTICKTHSIYINSISETISFGNSYHEGLYNHSITPNQDYCYYFSGISEFSVSFTYLLKHDDYISINDLKFTEEGFQDSVIEVDNIHWHTGSKAKSQYLYLYVNQMSNVISPYTGKLHESVAKSVENITITSNETKTGMNIPEHENEEKDDHENKGDYRVYIYSISTLFIVIIVCACLVTLSFYFKKENYEPEIAKISEDSDSAPSEMLELAGIEDPLVPPEIEPETTNEN